MNNGLLAVIADTGPVREGEVLTLALDPGGRLLLDHQGGPLIECAPIAPFMVEMLELGGLVGYLRERGGFEGRP
jgi:hypothetical protein